MIAAFAAISAADGRANDLPTPAVRTFLDAHCIQCHDADTKKGGLNLSAVGGQLSRSADFRVWNRIHDRVAAGEMPPASVKKRPAGSESAAVTAEIGRMLTTVDQNRINAEGRSPMRRLNRTEYENTLRDLLDLPALNVKDLLPEDGRSNGFDKSAGALDISSIQMAKYMEAADYALGQAIAQTMLPPKSDPVRMNPLDQYDISILLSNSDAVFLKDFKYDPRIPLISDKWANHGEMHRAGLFKEPGTAGIFRHLDDAYQGRFSNFATHYAGRYKVRMSVWSYWWEKGVLKPHDRTEAVSLIAGGRVLHHLDAPSMKPTVHEVEILMNFNEYVSINGSSLWPIRVSERKGRAAEFIGPGVAIDWVEIEGPIHDRWPPAGHRRLFGDLPLLKGDQLPSDAVRPLREVPKRTHHGRNGLGRIEWAYVHPADPAAQAEKLLRDFLPRAFRRPVPADEAYRYVALALNRLAAGVSFEDALRTAYKTALCSPQFLFLHEKPGMLDDYALASRLSYFLWNSMPDEELMRSAAEQHLREPPVLHRQTERMLKDPKAVRFRNDFLDQWLDLQELDFTTPDRRLYPEFSGYLRDSMQQESRAFFKELIDKDLGVAHFVDSDFLMINRKLAELYGIPGIDGATIRRAGRPAGSDRGGFLTQASILKVTANGTTTSPVKRGAWVMRKLIGKPPEPPPPDIPAVEPDLRGTTTIREQLSKHRDHAACQGCHARMDPPGFALESFDVIGGSRDRYRSVEKGDAPVELKKRVPEYAHLGFRLGLPVDTAGETVDGKKFTNIGEFRKLLIGEQPQLARNFASQLLTYATGTPPSFADRAEVDQIVNRTAAKKYAVRSMILEVVQSKAFRVK